MKDNTNEIEKRILENGVKKTFTGSLEQGKRDQLCLYLAGETYTKCLYRTHQPNLQK